MNKEKNNDRLDTLIARHLKKMPEPDDAAVERVIGRLPRLLPRQKGRLMSRLPGVLLDWNFAPAWPRMAALATCAVLGFMVGMAGLNQQIAGADGIFAAGQPPVFSLDSDPLADFD